MPKIKDVQGVLMLFPVSQALNMSSNLLWSILEYGPYEGVGSRILLRELLHPLTSPILIEPLQ